MQLYQLTKYVNSPQNFKEFENVHAKNNHFIPAEIKSFDITEDDVSVASATPEGTKLRVNTYMKRFYYDVSDH